MGYQIHRIDIIGKSLERSPKTMQEIKEYVQALLTDYPGTFRVIEPLKYVRAAVVRGGAEITLLEEYEDLFGKYVLSWKDDK
jgi:hypothetical protein